MPGFMPGIHALRHIGQDVDGRDDPGHDESIDAEDGCRSAEAVAREHLAHFRDELILRH
jgi:hypothetical protein